MKLTFQQWDYGFRIGWGVRLSARRRRAVSFGPLRPGIRIARRPRPTVARRAQAVRLLRAWRRDSLKAHP